MTEGKRAHGARPAWSVPSDRPCHRAIDERIGLGTVRITLNSDQCRLPHAGR
jgi:hypothetical protein